MSTSIQQLEQRLKNNYQNCTISYSNDTMEVKMPLGEVHIKGRSISFFIANKLLEKVEVNNDDEVYEEIESFIIFLQGAEEECNLIFNTANKNAQKRSRPIFYTAAVLITLAILGNYLFDLSYLLLIVIPLITAAMFVSLRFVRLHSFHQDWVCPHCGKKLPINSKEWNPQLKYVSQCPDCGASLTDKTLINNLEQELLADAEEIDEEDILSFEPKHPKSGGKTACIISCVLLIVFTVLSFFLMFVDIEKEAPAAIVINVITILSMGVLSFMLLIRPKLQEKFLTSSRIVVRERGFISGLGVCCWIVGLVFIIFSFSTSMEIPANLFEISFLALIGLFSVFMGVWMLLARKNRALYILDSSILYITSFGKMREIEISQIDSVRLTSSGSIHFLDNNKKKLFSVENNMLGASHVLDWVSKKNIPQNATKALEKQLKQTEMAESTISWKEEYRTPLHEHLGIIRLGMIFTVLVFAVGCIAPFVIYLLTDMKISHAIYLTAFAPVPMLLYYLAFAPVLLLDDKPEKATEEWKSNHIKFPTTIVTLLALLIATQVRCFWADHIVQIIDKERFYLLSAGIAATIIVLFLVRTPKRLRNGEGLFVMSLNIIMLSYVMFYGGNLAISTPVQHYPLTVVDRSEPAAEDDEEEGYTLTILLDDGSTETLKVGEQLYEMEKVGAEFVVCQKQNFLGIRMARLHLPEGTDIATLPSTTT